MATHLIGLLGRKRSGKDTFAQRLVEHHGYTRFAFADALKAAALELDPIIEAEPGTTWDYGYGGESYERACIESYTRLSDLVTNLGWESAKEVAEVRRVLQHMGTGVRSLDEGFWLRVVMDQVAAHDGPAVITDVRFPNEHAAVMAAPGFTVRITRPGLANDDLHISETALDHHVVDAEFANDSSIEALHAHADEFAHGVDRAVTIWEGGDGWQYSAIVPNGEPVDLMAALQRSIQDAINRRG